MKKRFLNLFMMVTILTLLFGVSLYAQDVENNATGITETTSAANEEMMFDESPQVGGFEAFARSLVGSGFVDLFLDGGFAMWPILVLLIWAIAVIIYKIIALSYARININALFDKIIPLLKEKKYQDAANVCAKTKGPVAAIIHAGLLKADRGVDAVEKAMESAGTIEMAFLEKGFVPMSTVINLAPMLGFFGTLVGMIQAFDAIAKAGEVDPTIVASGINVALITSAAGLAVAIPVQFFNNLLLGNVDGIVLDMQRGSEKVVETLIEN
ncbi:MAG: MotA/TolQ/ExbB proton channel family protein [Candidatus Stygibacter australis]|nr:MotA/TolQ/ExbB proton channel family protein [Candidatus Stygibacter australis]MDP8321456.1 MotA/TolQ/ExbB proton channel family protein [Candidatus Stygibacter australis]